MNDVLKGRAWVFGDNVDTDQIIPAKYLVTMNNDELAKHAFENAMPEFAGGVKKGDIVVAGRNFGCGSSREHAPRALRAQESHASSLSPREDLLQECHKHWFASD